MSDARVAHLLELRRGIAARSRALAERELEGRLLRLEIETALVAQGATKTDADKRAKADARYVAFERETARLAEERDGLLAEAEAARFGILLALADVATDA